MSPLAFLKEGERAAIVDLADRGSPRQRGRGCLEHLESIGLRPGKEVEMISNQGFGPLILRMDETRIALGRGMAMKITIRRHGE